MKRVAKVLGALVLAVLLVGGAFVFTQVRAFDASMARVWDIPAPSATRSTDPVVIARGKHLVESIGGCNGKDCHGADLAGGNTFVMGPVATITAPNLTPAGRAPKELTDGEMLRAIRDGVGKSGRSLRMMPSAEVGWLPTDDLVAVVSYLRAVPPIEKPDGPVVIGALGKVLDRQDKFPLDVARHIDHQKRAHGEDVPRPEPTALYGKFITLACTGCHGETLSGGPIPGAPSSLPVPLNVTPHVTGLLGWTFEDFDKLLTTGIRKNGKPLDPFMPVSEFGKMNDVEKRAVWAYLQTLPPKPFGGR